MMLMELPPYPLLSFYKLYVYWLVRISLKFGRATPSCRCGPGIDCRSPQTRSCPSFSAAYGPLGTQTALLLRGAYPVWTVMQFSRFGAAPLSRSDTGTVASPPRPTGRGELGPNGGGAKTYLKLRYVFQKRNPARTETTPSGPASLSLYSRFYRFYVSTSPSGSRAGSKS